MEDERYNRILKRIADLEQHIINVIVPLQGISEVFKDKHYIDESIGNLVRLLSKPLRVDADDVAKVRGHIEQLSKETKNMRDDFTEIQEKLARIDVLKFAEEMKFMAKRIYEMERTIAGIYEKGIKKNISLDFTVDGYQMVRKGRKSLDNDLIEEATDDQNLEKALLTLDDRERIVLCHRFGLLGYRKSTLEVTGKHIGITRERVRQVEAKGLRKLRNPCRINLVKKIKHKELLEAINPDLLDEED